jgi:hypothetical protein
MAISPTKLFVAVNDMRSRRLRDIVGPVNTHIVERARRYVWAQDSSQQAFIGKHMGKKLESLPLFPTLGKYPVSVPAFAG